MNIRLTKSPDRILFNIILIFVFLCPFIYLKGLYNYVTLPQSAFIQVFTLLILTIFTLSYLFSKKNISISTHPLNGAILFFLLWTLAASFYSHNHYEAFNQWYQWAACILLFFLLQIIIKSQSRALQLLGVIYAAGLFTAIIGLGQYLFNINIIPQSAPPSATFANKNMAAQFITLTFPLGIALLCWSRQRTFTWLAAMGSCVMIIFLIYTQTRAAWAAVCFELILILSIVLWKSFWDKTRLFWNKDKIIAFLAGLFMIVLFANIGPKGFKWQLPLLFNRLVSISDHLPDSSIPRPSGGKPHTTKPAVNKPPAAKAAITRSSSIKSSSIKSSGTRPLKTQARKNQTRKNQTRKNQALESGSLRLAIWQNTMEMIKKKPFTGYGLGNHKIYYPLFHTIAVKENKFSEDHQLVHVHNDFLQLFSETGVIGIIAVFIVFLSFFAIIVKLLRTHIDSAFFPAMGIGVSAAGILINSCFSFPFEMPIPPLILMIYFSISLCLLQNPGAYVCKPSKRWLVFLIVILIPVFYWSVRYYCVDIKCDRYYLQIKHLERQGKWKYVTALANKAFSLNPDRKKMLSFSARGYIESGEYQKGIDALQAVIQAYPFHMNALLNMGAAQGGLKKYDKAMTYYEKVLEIKPDHSKAHNNMADIYMNQKKYGKAIESFQKAAATESYNPNILYNMAIAQIHLKEYEQAAQSLKKTVAIKPDWAKAQLNLAILYYQHLGRQKDSVPHFKKAMDLDPKIQNKDQIKKIIDIFSET
jgi:O-antigen ligase/Tfp pilus assembly protein PilF